MATIYKVKTIEVDGRVHVGWASSDGGARKVRRALAEQHGLRPLADVDYAPVEVPTSKGGLIDWLNDHHVVELNAGDE